MKFNFFVLTILLGVSLCFLSSCDSSRVPLGPPGKVPVDQRLTGIWGEVVDTSQHISEPVMQIYSFNDYEYLIELIPEDSTIENLLRFRAYTTKIGGENFANIQYLENDVEKLFNFYKYELVGENVLKVSTIKTSYYKDPLFSSSKKLYEFMHKHLNDPEIYEQESFLIKMEQ